MQARALKKTEAGPMMASLGVLQGDLALIAHTLLAAIGRNLAAGDAEALADPQTARALDLALKVARQEERYAHLQRLPAPAEPPSDRLRRGEDRGF
jgi:hypothetical protein